MARASSKRNRRARAHARSVAAGKAPAETTAEVDEAAQAAGAPDAPVATAEKRREPRPEKKTERKEERKPAKPQRVEDTMFFTRLRTHAKWVFVLLAAVFAIGFVAFGVGAGGTGFGDAISDFFGDDDQPSVAEAQSKVEESPNDAAAVLALARAYEQNAQLDEAAATYEQYAKLAPDDEDALRSLAALYETQARQQFAQAQEPGRSSAFAQTLYGVPTLGGFVNALGNNPIEDAIAAGQARVAQEAVERGQAIYAKQAAVYAALAAQRPDDPNGFLQAGTSFQNAGENEKAVAAYEKYLALVPEDDPVARQVQDVVDQLQRATDDTVVG